VSKTKERKSIQRSRSAAHVEEADQYEDRIRSTPHQHVSQADRETVFGHLERNSLRLSPHAPNQDNLSCRLGSRAKQGLSPSGGMPKKPQMDNVTSNRPDLGRPLLLRHVIIYYGGKVVTSPRRPAELFSWQDPPRQASDDRDELGTLHRLGNVRLEARHDRAPAVVGSGERGQCCRRNAPALFF
jgi:hypothetical protein